MSAEPENLTLDQLKLAAQIYLAQAYPAQVPTRILERLDFCGTLKETLERFELVDRDRTRSTGLRRWAIRLGNDQYPFMKLVVEECDMHEMPFLSVDTHDQATLVDAAQGQEAWRKVQRFNAKLRARIETAWRDADLPTRRQLLAARRADSFRSKPTPGAGGLQVLIVDDEEDAAELLKLQLARFGVVATTCHWGEEAINLAREAKPAAIIVDFMMPGMSGSELCRALKHDTELREIPVLLATYADLDSVHDCPADVCLLKPFVPQTLVDHIRELTRN